LAAIRSAVAKQERAGNDVQSKDGVGIAFLLSLPRSGSTLFQRLLASHTAIESPTEPWLLVPLVYALRPAGAYTEYVHPSMATSLRDFVEDLPGGLSAYDEQVRSMVSNLYLQATSEGKRYFLDKTPRYGLIVHDLLRIFPDARYLFIWRSPLGILASLIRSFGDGRWNLHRHSADLFEALPNLIDASRELGDRAANVRFEDLVTQPERELRRVCDYLDLEYQPEMTTKFASVRPTHGDPVGTKSYREVSLEPLDKWTIDLANPLRRRWARRYLLWLGEDRLRWMGYDLDNLLRQLEDVPLAWHGTGSDAARILYGLGYNRARARALRRPSRGFPQPT